MVENGSAQMSAWSTHVSPKQFTGSQRTERKEVYFPEESTVIALPQGSFLRLTGRG